VYDSYGSKSNHRFLLNYGAHIQNVRFDYFPPFNLNVKTLIFNLIINNIGFAVEDNREADGFCPNEVSLNLSISPSDPFYDVKMEFWTRPGYPLAETSFEKAINLCNNQLTQRGVKSSISATSINITALKGDEILSTSLTPRLSNFHCRLRSSSIDSFASSIKSVRICVLPNHESTKILFSLCRVLACNGAELMALSEQSSFSSNPGWNLLGFTSSSSSGNITFNRTCRDVRHPISLRNEKEALSILLNLIQSSLSKYPTSLAQDIDDLFNVNAYPLYSNRRHAKIQVKGEKEILHHFACLSHVGLSLVSIIEKELEYEKGDNMAQVEPNFDQALQSLDYDGNLSDGQKLIIFRYCFDVLGALRKEEIRKAQAL